MKNTNVNQGSDQGDKSINSFSPHSARSTADFGPSGHGRILKLKSGYNPNSSSVGSHIPTFFAVAGALGGITVFVLNAISKAGKILKKKAQETEEEPENNGEKDKP